MTQLREFAQSKRDHFLFDPKIIAVDPSYNIRDLGTADAKASLDELALSIQESGLRVPLLVRLDGDTVKLVQGHRRLAAIMLLISRGVPFEAVECLAESKKRDDAERTLDLILSNDGAPLTEMEKAEVVRRLRAYGWDQKRIAIRIGKSASYVSHLESLLQMPAEVQTMVREGEVSAHAALKLVREEGPEAATETLVEAVAEVQAEIDAAPQQPLSDGTKPAKEPKQAKVKPEKIKAVTERKKGTNIAREEPAHVARQNVAKQNEALFGRINRFLTRCQDGTYEDEDNEVPQKLHTEAKELAELIKLYGSGVLMEAAE